MPNWVYDELILATKLVYDNSWHGVRAQTQAAQELSKLLKTAPFHDPQDRGPTFRSANSVQRKTFDIATQHPNYAGTPTRGNRLDRVVLEEFRSDPTGMCARAIEIRKLVEEGTDSSIDTDNVDWTDFAAREGRLLVVRHLRIERNINLRAKKLAEKKASGNLIKCEVCAFDFYETYGQLGYGYIQLHHVLPLHASGPARPQVRDLSLLCANCHCIIHRSSPFLTPTALRSKIGLPVPQGG